MNNQEDSFSIRNLKEDLKKEKEKLKKQEEMEEEPEEGGFVVGRGEERSKLFNQELQSRPQEIFVKEKQITELLAMGKVNLRVNLYGRELKPGEEVILLGEERKINAKFVCMINKGSTGASIIEVCL